MLSEKLSERLKQRLDAHQKAGLVRKRVVSSSSSKLSHCFSSNDYLGLAKHPKLIKALQKGAELYGFGSGGSQLVSGHSRAHAECEEAFAKFLNRDRALLFANGYVANLGLFQTLHAITSAGSDKNSEAQLFFDKYNHASLYDGAKLSEMPLQRYNHLDLTQLEQLLEKNQRKNQQASQVFIFSEHVFSTDGSQANISKLIALSQKYQATLLIDDAHGIGVFDFPYSQEEVPVLMCPLGKALGGFGGIIAGSSDFIEGLMQFSRSYMFSTAPPAAIAYALSASLALIQEEPWRREKLFENIKFFKKTATDMGLIFSPSDHPIQSLILGDPEKAVLLKNNLLNAGFEVAIMRPPSVPHAKTLLRVSLSAGHEKSDIEIFLRALSESLPPGETEISEAKLGNFREGLPNKNPHPSPLPRAGEGKNTLKFMFIPGFGFSPEIFRSLGENLARKFLPPELHKSHLQFVNLLDLIPEASENLEASLEISFEKALQKLIPEITPQTFIIGFSLGGLLALKLNQYAGQYEQFARGICLISSTYYFMAEENWPGISPDFFNKFEMLFKKNPEKALNQFLLLQGPESQINSRDKAFLLNLKRFLITHENPEKWEYWLRVLKQIDLREVAVHCPLIIIKGDQDILLPEDPSLSPAGGRGNSSHFPPPARENQSSKELSPLPPAGEGQGEGKIKILKNKGHFFLEDPECSEAVIAFIEKVLCTN